MEDKIELLIEPLVKEHGCDIVLVKSFNEGQKIQILIERSDFKPLSIDECEKVHKAVALLLQVEFENKSFEIEVSSPGVDRPLIKLQDYARFAGFEASLLVPDEKVGKRRITVQITGVNDSNKISFIEKGKSTQEKVPFEDIISAQLTTNNINLLKKKVN